MLMKLRNQLPNSLNPHLSQAKTGDKLICKDVIMTVLDHRSTV